MNTSFGETLRAAREAKGLTTSQIAAKTRMLVQIVEEMENEDFHRIAAPIYGRGFVKLYAECVDLDPLPLVKEFMDIYEGRRAPIVRTRDVPVQAPPPAPEPVPEPIPEPPPAPEPVPEPIPAPPPAPEPEPEPIPEPPPAPEPVPEPIPEPPPAPEPVPEPIPEPPPVVRGLELFEAAAPSQPQPAPEPAPSSTAEQPPAANVADIFSGSPYLSTESTYGSEGPSAAERFRTSLSSVSHGVIESVREIPRSFWRIALLVITTLVLLAILVWGCIKLYQATSITPIQPPPTLNASQDLKDTKDLKDAKSSKDLKDTKSSKDLNAPKTTKAATKPSAQPQPKAATKPSAQPQPKAGDRPAPAALQAAGKNPPAKPTKRPPLRSTGQKVPPLYAD